MSGQILDLEPQTKLDTAGKRALIEKELGENPRRSNRAIAAIIGCDHKTVGTVRGEISPTLSPGDGDLAASSTRVVDVVVTTSKIPPPPGVVDEPPHDFFDPNGEDLVVPHQPAIAVYENIAGAVAIRQRVDDDEDTVIFVQPAHVERLVQRLRKIVEQIGE